MLFVNSQPTKRQQYQVKLLDLYQSVLLMEKVKSLALEVVYSPEADKLVVQHCWDVLVGMLLNQKGLTEDHMYKVSCLGPHTCRFVFMCDLCSRLKKGLKL